MNTALLQPCRNWIVVGVALLAAIVGWWAGGWGRPASVRPASGGAPPPAPASAGVTREVESTLARVAAETSSVKQFALLAAAPPPRTPGALRAWLDRLETLPNAEARELAERLLFRSGAAVPHEAMAAVLRDRDSRAGAALARVWAEQEGVAGLTRALALEGAPLAHNIVRIMAVACARTDPQATLDALLQQPALVGITSTAVSALFSEWTSVDPEKATAAFATLAPDQRASVANGMARSWAATDPRRALAWVDDQKLSPWAAAAVFETWIAKEPRVAADAWLARGPNETGSSGLWYTWAGTDAAGMVDWLNARPDISASQRGEIAAIAASSLAETDPDRAWALVRDDSVDGRTNVLSTIGHTLFAKDGAAAVAWAGQLTVAADRESFYAAMCDMGGTLTSEQRGAVLAALPGAEPAAAWAKLALLATTDPAAAREYWATLPGDSRTGAVDDRFFAALERSSPDLAALVARERLVATQQAGEATEAPDAARTRDLTAFEASRVAVLLSQRDPEAARQWVESLPPGPQASDVTANLAANLGRLDRAGVDSWLREQPLDSPLRPGLLRGVARLEVELGNPAAAFEHVRQLNEGDAGRMSALREVLNSWRAVDEAAATKAYEEVPLTGEERMRLGLPGK